MPGFEKSRIVGLSEEDLDEFTCNICFEIFVNPVVAQCCRQTYCKECINEWLTHDSSCPNDRQPLSSDELSSAPRIINNLLSNMKVKCGFESNGCKSVVRMHELADHSKDCDYNPNINCKICGLSKYGSTDEHNCIENLIIKNESISDEIERLRKENEKLKTEKIETIKQNTNQEKIMSDIIKSARNNIIDYVVEEPINTLAMNKRYICINQCREAVLKYNSYSKMCEYLVDVLNKNSEMRNTESPKIWHAIAFCVNGGESLLVPNEYFRIRFDKLIIELFTARD